MSIYDKVSVGPSIRFSPDFSGGSESVAVTVEYSEEGQQENSKWEDAWDLNGGRKGHFCVPLRVWEAFQHYGRSAYG